MPHPSHRLRAAAILAIAATVAVGCGNEPPDDPSPTNPQTRTSTPAASATADVGTNGATVTTMVDGMRVTAAAPAGVAATGTPFRISATAAPGERFDTQVAASDAVRLELGSGEQPQAPIDLRFDLSEQPKLAGLMSDTVRPFVRSVSDGDPTKSDYLLAEWDSSAKVLSATAEHLSDFQVIFADIGKAVDDAVKKWTLSDGPVGSACDGSGGELKIGGTNYTLTSSKPDAPVTGCLTDAGGVGIKLANASDNYYGVVSDPSGEYSNSGAVSSDEMMATWLRRELDGAGLLVPKGGGQITLPADTTRATVRADVDPMALQLNTVFTALDMLGVDTGVLETALLDSKTAWDCVSSTIEAVKDPAGVDADEYRNSLGDLAQCGLAGADVAVGAKDGNFILHKMGVAVSLFTELPDALVANISGAIGEFTGDNHLEFTLTSKSDEAQEPAQGSSTLVPLVLKSHGSPGDSGTELGPNHFQLGHILKHDGKFYVSLDLRWETADDEAVAEYCTERSKVVDSSGNVVLERKQDLGGCEYGGGWGFNITSPGTYTYVLDVDRRGGGSVHAEQQFVVDP
jgi:hypothetical protein